VVELHNVLFNLVAKLKQRKDDQFYGVKAQEVLDTLDLQSEKEQFQHEANSFLTKAISYILKFYNFDDPLFKTMEKLNIKTNSNMFTWQNLDLLV
jgi:hypothetical protein